MKFLRRKKPQLTVLFVILASLPLFNAVEGNLRDFRKSIVALATGAKSRDWHNFLRRRGGEELLPEMDRDLIALVRSHKLKTYSYSKGIGENQRLIEGAYPVVPRRNSVHRLYLADEPLPTECVEMEVKGKVRLADCS